jgi:integrase
MDIKKDILYKEYVLNRNLKFGTIRSYTRKLQIYSEVTGLTLSQLIEQAEDDEDNGIRLRKRRIKKNFQDLQDHLLENDYSSRKIRDTISTVRGFYNYFEIQLPNRTYNADTPDLEESDIPSKEDIQLAITNSNLRYATIIMLMCTSGITLVDVMNLKFSDFLLSLKISPQEFEKSMDIEFLSNSWNEKNIQAWHIHRQKSGTEQNTFSTPETTRQIFMYLEQYPPQAPDDFLFRGNTGKRMREDVFQRFLRKLNKKCGWDSDARQIFIHSHSFRKYFSNALEGNGMPHHYTRQLIGHRKDTLTRAYFYTALNRLKQEYFRYMPCLYFFEEIEVKVITDEKLEMMEHKLMEMEKTKEYIDKILNNPIVLKELNKINDI